MRKEYGNTTGWKRGFHAERKYGHVGPAKRVLNDLSFFYEIDLADEGSEEFDNLDSAVKFAMKLSSQIGKRIVVNKIRLNAKGQSRVVDKFNVSAELDALV